MQRRVTKIPLGWTRLLIFCLIAVFFSPVSAHAKARATVKDKVVRAENPRAGKEWLVLPYAFAAESMGTVLGLGGSLKGYAQDQLLLAGTVFGGPQEVAGVVLGAWDYQPRWSERIFLSFVASAGHYPRRRAYSDLSYDPNKPRRGGNDSNKDDYVETPGDNNWTDLRLEYVLPLGAARQTAMMTYHLKGGILQGSGSGGATWNPLQGGVTTLLFRQYNQTESFETESAEYERSIHSMELALGYDNTDFPGNPSTGSSQYLAWKQDFGWGEAPYSWSFWELEASKYFPLGESSRAKQRVLAFNAWTGHSTSWREEINSEGEIVITHRPPQYDGATLGGFYRLRGYPSRRFNDRSVIYATGEYRYTFRRNPVGEISWLRWLKMDWWQLVGFVEGGRVANDYSLPELFSDWKMDAGLGVRALMAGAVVRLDLARSEEGTGIWVMIGHPF